MSLHDWSPAHSISQLAASPHRIGPEQLERPQLTTQVAPAGQRIVPLHEPFAVQSIVHVVADVQVPPAAAQLDVSHVAATGTSGLLASPIWPMLVPASLVLVPLAPSPEMLSK